ncbi:oligosaccharide flippase family protein [Microbacterium sp. ISL-103]|uniref:lipopolysaccharide biosynthesis protein n=1 Tax=Microbacterium sp. ISL-103 TaxID=2819156 RepID=UPI001BE69FE3|nr:oligosaccharide flippase family protein [Microbacterium sp. ISL-103]
MRGRVGRGLVALVSGAAFGQLILILATPFLARIYGPAAFGAFSALVAATSVLGPVAALKFDVGVMLPKEEDQARRLVRLALGSSLASSVMAGLVIWLISSTPMGRSWSLVPYAPLWGGALVFATSVFTVLTQAALRRRVYGVVASRAVFQSAGTAGSQLGLGLLGVTQIGLTAGFLAGRLLGFVPLLRVSRPLLSRPASGSYRETIREYIRLPTALAGAALINSIGTNLPLLLIAAGFGEIAAGEFGMAQRLITVPATLLGASVAQVVGAELAELLRERRSGARRIYRQTTIRLGMTAVVVGIAIIALAPLLPFVLGDGWSRTVPIAQAMALAAAAALIGSPLSQVYTIYQSRATALIDAIRVVLLLLAWAAVGIYGFSLVEATWAISVSQTLGYILLWWYGRRLVEAHERTVESG